MHFEVADVDAEYNRLKRLGVEFDEPPEDQALGLAARIHSRSRRAHGLTLRSASERQVA